jgi:hypothetical protein
MTALELVPPELAMAPIASFFRKKQRLAKFRHAELGDPLFCCGANQEICKLPRSLGVYVRVLCTARYQHGIAILHERITLGQDVEV